MTDDYQSCWQVLGIEPIQDKKAIKRAYAKLLKVTRPDEDPQGFQRLNSAYNEALEYLEYDWYWLDDDQDCDDNDDWHEDQTDNDQSEDQEEINDNLELNTIAPPIAQAKADDDKWSHNLTGGYTIKQEIIVKESFNLTKDKSEDDKQSDDDLLKEINHSNQQKQQFYQKVSELFQHEIKRNILSKWQELLQDDILYDVFFKEEMSMVILEHILDLRLQQMEAIEEKQKVAPNHSEPPIIAEPILQYLATYFHWHDNYSKIEDRFYYHEALNQFYDDLDPITYIELDEDHSVHKHIYNALAPLSTRFFAFVIDCLIFAIGCFIVLQSITTLKLSEGLLTIYLLLALFIIGYIPTKFGATFGQKILKLRMVDENGNNINSSQALSRFFSVVLAVAGLMAVAYFFWLVALVAFALYVFGIYDDKVTSTDESTSSYVVKDKEFVAF